MSNTVTATPSRVIVKCPGVNTVLVFHKGDLADVDPQDVSYADLFKLLPVEIMERAIKRGKGYLRAKRFD